MACYFLFSLRPTVAWCTCSCFADQPHLPFSALGGPGAAGWLWLSASLGPPGLVAYQVSHTCHLCLALGGICQVLLPGCTTAAWLYCLGGLCHTHCYAVDVILNQVLRFVLICTSIVYGHKLKHLDASMAQTCQEASSFGPCITCMVPCHRVVVRLWGT